MTERKCCNCCLYAEMTDAPIRRAKRGPAMNTAEGRIVCMAKWGATESPYYKKSFYFTRRPCVFFKQSIHCIYGIEDENFYVDWIKARIARMSLRIDDDEKYPNYNSSFDSYYPIRPTRLHEYDELSNHLQYHKQLRNYPRKPRDAYSKYDKVL